MVICPTCKGSGFVRKPNPETRQRNSMVLCPDCGGEGKLPQPQPTPETPE